MDEKRVFISVPMAGRSDQDIVIDINEASLRLAKAGYINTFCAKLPAPIVARIPEENRSLALLGRGLQQMARCNMAYFCKGWEDARGCRIEHECAKEYGLEILYEETLPEAGDTSNG